MDALKHRCKWLRSSNSRQNVCPLQGVHFLADLGIHKPKTVLPLQADRTWYCFLVHGNSQCSLLRKIHLDESKQLFCFVFYEEVVMTQSNHNLWYLLSTSSKTRELALQQTKSKPPPSEFASSHMIKSVWETSNLNTFIVPSAFLWPESICSDKLGEYFLVRVSTLSIWRKWL